MRARVVWLWCTLSGVYRSWRGPLALIVGATVVAVPLTLVGGLVRASVVALLSGLAWAAVTIFVGVEIARQDRLRQQHVEAAVPSATGSALARAVSASRIHPDVTILTTVHDNAEALPGFIGRLQAQTWPSFLCAIIDDGSTDRTVERAFELSADDDRFRVFAPEPSAARDALDTWLGATPARRIQIPPFEPVDRTWLEVQISKPGEDLRLGWPRSMPLVELREPVVAPFAAGAVARGTVILMPEAAYHVDELGPLANVLEQRGHEVAFLVSDRRLAYVTPSLRRQTQRVFRYPKADVPADEIASAAGAIVAMNDWGEAAVIVDAANRAGVPTFGKVEGVQDFHDVDTPVVRRPYRRVHHVLAQGSNDVAAMGAERSSIVGSSRLERAWSAGPTHEQEDLVVLNVNFTYDVWQDARGRWIETAVEACRRAGRPFVLSIHPSEVEAVEVAEVAKAPMRHLLTRASVLVSRFSTVPFEAIARGVRFVYHNPHGERAPTFQNPDGAFDISITVDQLGSRLRNAPAQDPRARGEAFFRRQVDVDPDKPSEERAADVIDRALSSARR